MPVVISHGSTEHRSQPFHQLFDWVGTTDPTAYLAVPHAIDFIGSLLPGGWSAVREHNRNLALRGREIVATAIGAEGLPAADLIGSMAAIPLTPAAAGHASHPDPSPRRCCGTMPSRYRYGCGRDAAPGCDPAQLYNGVDYERPATALGNPHPAPPGRLAAPTAATAEAMTVPRRWRGRVTMSGSGATRSSRRASLRTS
jgi:hypothetical protein